jgi:dGTPase
VAISQPLYSEGDRQRVVNIESAEAYRSPWRRDYARLLHSSAFRRLQGKTQLFPGSESDFFRNRLTHSLEVADVAKTIALKFNLSNPYFQKYPIDLDLIEIAGLAHDLGHPPFGHNGESALDFCMKEDGGFEGNAQSLRILSKLEKRDTPTKNGQPINDGVDVRAGLNLTYRGLATVLKYDRKIPQVSKDRKNSYGISKGYYYTEDKLVREIKSAVGFTELKEALKSEGVRAANMPEFRTIECSIMDIADDIAYATYDIEDALKAHFLNTTTVLREVSTDKQLREKIIDDVKSRLRRAFPGQSHDSFDEREVIEIIVKAFYPGIGEVSEYADMLFSAFHRGEIERDGILPLILGLADRNSYLTASDGYFRTAFTSRLIRQFVQAVEVNVYERLPAISQAYLPIDMFKEIEVLKTFTFHYVTTSSRLKISEFRGQEAIVNIFKAIDDGLGHMVLPEDFRRIYEGVGSGHEKRRVICDFIAGMTDRYATQFSSRLFGHQPEAFWTPL